eukprot:scaffold58674_cov44-Attheya_sp.AAC.3
MESGTLQHAGAGNSTGSNRNDPHEFHHGNPIRATGKDFSKLYQAAQFITERGKAGIMLPIATDINNKSKLPVIDALRSPNTHRQGFRRWRIWKSTTPFPNLSGE